MTILPLVLPFLVTACGTEKDTAPVEDTSHEDTTPVDTAPEITYATVEIINMSGGSIWYIYQCVAETLECIDVLGGSLADDHSMDFQVEPGNYKTYIVDEESACAYSGEYPLFAGDEYSWTVRDIKGAWDGTNCVF